MYEATHEDMMIELSPQTFFEHILLEVTNTLTSVKFMYIFCKQ